MPISTTNQAHSATDIAHMSAFLKIARSLSARSTPKKKERPLSGPIMHPTIGPLIDLAPVLNNGDPTTKPNPTDK